MVEKPNLARLFDLISRIFYIAFWYFDAFIVLVHINFFKGEESYYLHKSCKYWLIGLALGQVRDILEAFSLLKIIFSDKTNVKAEIYQLKLVGLEMAARLFDMVLAMSELYYKGKLLRHSVLHDGVTGVCGVFSSMLTFYKIWYTA